MSWEDTDEFEPYDVTEEELFTYQQKYVDLSKQFDIAHHIVNKLRDYAMGHGLDMLTSNNSISDLIMLL
jgi:hypothetical protein